MFLLLDILQGLGTSCRADLYKVAFPPGVDLWPSPHNTLNFTVEMSSVPKNVCALLGRACRLVIHGQAHTF
jgi:hypothetical protein